MSKTYKIQVNDTYTFDMSEEQVKDLDSITNSNSKHFIAKDNTSFGVGIKEVNFSAKGYQIRVNGNVYKVKIKDELDMLINKLGLTVGNKQKEANVMAPMPGLILEIQVKDGQEVREGDPLLVLEAMKMENVLLAPKDGIIKTIEVAVGDAVDKKQLLIEME